MKNFKRILLTVVSAMLLMAVTVVGTLAYLNATTGQVTNTFTVGNVSFTDDLNQGLDEAPVDVYGEVVEGDRVKENVYKLLPSHKYHKDPTVHIAANSEPAWLFVKVENGIKGIEVAEGAGDPTIAAQMAEQGFLPLDGVENVYYYSQIVDTLDGKQKDILIFSSFTLKADLTEENIEAYKDAEIVIDAYLIQYDGLATVEAAWAAAAGAGFEE